MSAHRLFLLGAACVMVATAGAAGPLDDVRAALAQRLPAITIETVSPAPVPGWFEVAYDGGVFYVSGDGRYVLNGKLIDLEAREDLTERALGHQRLRILSDVPESKMIIFEPHGEAKHTITTFTDIDCPYCRRMHREMAQMNDAGIRVRYLLYPRAGFPSTSYDKAVSVWCAPDRRAAMTRAKAGEALEKRTCDDPVGEHMTLAGRLGLTGTPFTITDTGRVIPGYKAAPELLETLEADKQARR